MISRATRKYPLSSFLSADRLRHTPWCIFCNLLVLYLCYTLCRVAFVLENWNMFGETLTGAAAWRMFRGGLHFDTSAICYYNLPYLLLVLLPLHYKERRPVQILTKWVYVIINSVCIVANLCDCVYYQFTMRRTTATVFREFAGNTNLGAVFATEIFTHWYLVLLGIALIALLIYAYVPASGLYPGEKLKRYYIRQGISLAVVGVLAVWGMRGYFFFTSSRPIAMSNAYEYVDTQEQTGIVLNTPFTFLRTSMHNQLKMPAFYTDSELTVIYNPLHMPADSVSPKRKNVVILIVESFAEEFMGERNKSLDGGTYRGYTPFADSLMRESLTFERTFCNTFLSIDAMPAVLSSIPKLYSAFVLTPYATGDIPSIARELKNWGYTSAFFHGAENSSMGFQAYARSAGFDKYYGRTEYDADPAFDGEKDFDGTWAIWDEEFLQFFCSELSKMQQPFVAGMFTASSHHPFAIPDRYKDVFPDEGKYPLHKCIRYTDYSLRRFFESARKQPWYENTIFVLCADHASSKVTHDVYNTTLGHFRVPIIFYDPSGEMPRGVMPGIAQQIDIMPTLLGYLGYDRPFVSFGNDLLATPAEERWSLNFHNIPQFVKGDYMIQLSDFDLSAVYRYKTDELLQDNLLLSGDYDKAYVDAMLRQARAIMQEIDTREFENNMICKLP